MKHLLSLDITSCLDLRFIRQSAFIFVVIGRGLSLGSVWLHYLQRFPCVSWNWMTSVPSLTLRLMKKMTVKAKIVCTFTYLCRHTCLLMFVSFLLAERACRLLPSLHEAFSEVEELAGTGPAARHALLTRVTEVTLPLLCSYISRWGEAENHSSEDGYCSSVTPKHSNALLGHILSTINAHLGTADSAWMKRLAGK